MQVWGRTEKGPVRQDNQDAFCVGDLGEHDCFVVVCDGMGGEKGGEVASGIAVERIGEVIRQGYRPEMGENAVRDMLQSAISSANALVFAEAQQDKLLEGMGTTVVAAVVRPNMAFLINVGDSRAYRIFDAGIEQVTRDHTMVQALVEQGKISEEEARTHAQKHLITRALGVEERVESDYFELPLEPNEILLFCTDGLTGPLRRGDLFALVESNLAKEAVDRLIDTAVAEAGTDNITVVMITHEGG